LSLSNEELKKFWDIANGLRKNLDAAEYKHIVLGLVFLKYISDSFEGRRIELEQEFSDKNGQRYKAAPDRRAVALEERDYYKEVNVFWVPVEARWDKIQANSKQPKIAEMIDEALLVIERENPKLEGILERKYSDAKLTPAELGAVVDLIGTMSFGKGRAQASDTLGQVYEYFLGMFASAEGKLGGQFYTTPSIVKTLVEVLQPTKGRIYDPCCGSGGMFVQSERFVEAHGGKLGEISIYGQESNPTTRRLCAMNLAIRGIDFNLGNTHGDTFTDDQHSDLRFDFILMNPPFGSNASYPKAQLLNDVRWKKFGVPREKPANYAWMSHAIHHLGLKGRAGVVMPRGTLTSAQGGDGDLRTAFLDAGIVECIIDMPGQLFFNTPIPCALWFFNKDKSAWPRGRENEVLLIDASGMGKQISKSQKELSDDEISLISNTFKSWTQGDFEDVPEFARSVSREEIRSAGDVLAVGRYLRRSVLGQTELDASNSIPALSDDLLGVIDSHKKLLSEIESHIKKPFAGHKANSSNEHGDADSGTVFSIDISTKLHNLAQSYFQDWFINFEPVKARVSSVPSKTVPEHLLSLFPSAFEECELGLIPAGWRVGQLGEIIEVIDCLHSRKPELLGNGKPYIQLRAISRNGVLLVNSVDRIADADYELWTSRIEVAQGDCIITNVGRVGAVAQIPKGFRGAIGRNITALHPRHSDYGALLVEAMLSPFMRNEIRANTDSGTILDALNVKDIPKLSLVIPPMDVISLFSSVVQPIRDAVNELSGFLGDAYLEEDGDSIASK
jgi:type I restriction enzyme M protein